MQERIIELLLGEVEIICELIGRSDDRFDGEGVGEERQPVQQEKKGFDSLKVVQKDVIIVFLQPPKPQVHAITSILK